MAEYDEDGDEDSVFVSVSPPYQSLLLQQVAGFLLLFAILVLELLQPESANGGERFPSNTSPVVHASFLGRPLFHFLFHVDALRLQQLSLGKGPVHRLGAALAALALLPLGPGLSRVDEAEHMALPQDDATALM